MSKGTALITGASSGIGAALARRFAEMQFDLVVTARREAQLTELAEALQAEVEVHVVVADLSTDDGVDELIAAVEALEVDVDVLVNNAGVAYSGPFHRLQADEVTSLLAVNIAALTRLTHHFAPRMVERGAGRILNVASMAAFQPVPSMSLYAASKAFVLSFSEGISEELRGTGVTVTALCPGFTKTDMVMTFDGFELPPFIMASAEEVAREGYDAAMAREVIRVPGLVNQAALFWTRHQPRWLVRGLGGLVSRFNTANR